MSAASVEKLFAGIEDVVSASSSSSSSTSSSATASLGRAVGGELEEPPEPRISNGMSERTSGVESWVEMGGLQKFSDWKCEKYEIYAENETENLEFLSIFSQKIDFWLKNLEINWKMSKKQWWPNFCKTSATKNHRKPHITVGGLTFSKFGFLGHHQKIDDSEYFFLTKMPNDLALNDLES